MDLAARIEAELRRRLEDAAHEVALEALVEARRARGLPLPASESAGDRLAHDTSVRAFLAHLESALARELSLEQAARVEAARQEAPDEAARLVAVQVVLARELPDYWQRFEACRASFSFTEPLTSGRERRGLLGRLFRRG